MKLQHFLALLCLLFFSSGVFAYRCMIDMRKIDEALTKKPAITAMQEAEVRKLCAEGEALHKKGKHQALKIPGVQ